MHGIALWFLGLVPALSDASIPESPPHGYLQDEDLGPMFGRVWHDSPSLKVWPSKVPPRRPKWQDDWQEHDRALHKYQVQVLACAAHYMPHDRPRTIKMLPEKVIAEIHWAQDWRDIIFGREIDWEKPRRADPDSMARWNCVGPDTPLELAIQHARKYRPYSDDEPEEQ
jgi:hypothetical protein